jgi:hypothetical protein
MLEDDAAVVDTIATARQEELEKEIGKRNRLDHCKNRRSGI